MPEDAKAEDDVAFSEKEPAKVAGEAAAVEPERARGICVDGYLVRPEPEPALARKLERTAISVVGGSLPVGVHELARRAYAYALDPLRNPVKEVLDAFPSVREAPPMLGIFNDITPSHLRNDEVMCWAKAGFSFIVVDGEHMQQYGCMGRDANAMLGRAGLLSVQRLHREAVSQHGDALLQGARATMRPYGTTLAEAKQYYRAVTYPKGTPGTATPECRGGYPTRLGDRTMCFTPNSLRASEAETQGWIQFETSEYILDVPIRDQVLDLMSQQGDNKAAGFVGPFDAIIRDGPTAAMADGINALLAAGADYGVALGRVCGSGSLTDPRGIEDAMVEAIQNGGRLLCVHYMTSDLPFKGAESVTRPFFNACARCGF
eukprot:NODE_10179_length_1371_cov_4.367363.p1 GENE.NODE_10179_length_1371_cov_4.367363~~NODE_10179_length_1371_cov_4.367363.p1  ORF type:complete len:375 (-),score=122.90 NODE_10179_length_1371_cov_4.367363:169-1293(-)